MTRNMTFEDAVQYAASARVADVRYGDVDQNESHHDKMVRAGLIAAMFKRDRLEVIDAIDARVSAIAATLTSLDWP